MKRAIVVYESIYGNTKKLAETIAEGMMQAGNIKCDVMKTGEIHHTDDLAAYDAILFGCPNHNQEPARNMLKFLDRVAIVGLQSKVGAAFDTYTGGNKGVALAKLETVIREKLPGLSLIAEGFSALVDDRKGPLAKNEISRASDFGSHLGLKLLEEC
ncbi:MAG: flavodoxin family protein [Candidatus Thorarchaeota archaeon]